MHQILWHRSTRSLISRYAANVWEDAELKIDPDPFCTLFKISSINKKAGSKLPLKPKSPFKWVLWILYHQQHQRASQMTPISKIIC